MPLILDQPDPNMKPSQVRDLCRTNTFHAPCTSGFAAGHAQANVVILPAKYAADFRALCARNPVPCPLLGETRPGDPALPAHLAKGADIRTDLARYNVYENGKLIENVADITHLWTEDSVAFFIGCSYTFEDALTANGLVPRHVELNNMTPCYKTEVQLMEAGPFHGRMVVSMRPYPESKLETVRKVTAPYTRAHGQPVGYGAEGAAKLGIPDAAGQNPTWGDATVMHEGEVPVYWGCGVTPQQAVLDSGIEGLVICHQPGMMMVLDLKSEELCE